MFQYWLINKSLNIFFDGEDGNRNNRNNISSELDSEGECSIPLCNEADGEEPAPGSLPLYEVSKLLFYNISYCYGHKPSWKTLSTLMGE